MRLNINKNIISLFFVSAFIFLKVVNAHAFSHFSEDDDDQTHCELCEIFTTTNQLTPFTNNSLTEIEQKFIVAFQEQKINFCYETSQYSITQPKSIYNKPPPSKS
ncbi:hypothetical protein D1816_01000 [Aquimarina sp. AD10]|uniref:DUF2946 domain-containing protein n=1 Tax=Aquimarina aggregata TaxID=1642818 RepID=A0A162CSN4_9FLAO|nr:MULTISPECIES: hypothetical protein [Aquimarina]AXT58987.1 hypothetical protein D1816_01000 [Aquimarina sp. AD10]KZS41584.1 hypothetical protein AWE51_21505 [Aquimarina aggregata]RKM95082.1 hypothetical protein D7033_17465 [Aquimarina sp. AD10]